ncbi:MAG: ATP synthase F1 subunit gamma, partial [Actinomycetia bacterium]|nr:ATP synthase F1 subunit gamma [Actinomycetes bacterium]
AKLRRAQENMEGARPYAGRLDQFLGALLSRPEVSEHPLTTTREGNKVEVVIVTSDKGLCGGFNSTMLREAVAMIGRLKDEGKEVRLTLIGRKGWDYFRRRPYDVRAKHIEMFQALSYQDAFPVADELIALFEEGGADQVIMIGNFFKSIMAPLVKTTRLLPLATDMGEEPAESAYDPLFEPGEEKIIAQLVPRVVRVLIAQALFESFASEQASRMTAMDTATTNAGEMIDQLTLTMNTVRQAAITRELIEIVSGAEAL